MNLSHPFQYVTIAQGPLGIFSSQVGWILSFLKEEQWEDTAGGEGLAYCFWCAHWVDSWIAHGSRSDGGLSRAWPLQCEQLASPAPSSCSPRLPQRPVPAAWATSTASGSGYARGFPSSQSLYSGQQPLVTRHFAQKPRTEGVWDVLF